MRKLCHSAGLIVAILLLSAVVLAEEWKKDYGVGSAPALQVQTNDASIQVRAASGQTISARVTTNNYSIGPGGVRITEHQVGDSVSLQVKLPNRHFAFGFSNHNNVQIELSVPQNTTVSLTTSDGPLRISGLRAPANLLTSDGSIIAEDMEGGLVARTSNGSITASGRFDNLDLSTSDGNVRCEVRAGSRVNGGWNLRSSDGNVELKVPRDLAADLEAWTSDGRVTVDLPIMVEGSQSRNRVRGRINGGGGLLKVHTSDGSITVSKF